MIRLPVITKDGSHTLEVPSLKATYHSLNGAIAESMHVYIEAGFKDAIKSNPKRPLQIFEMGFGTGLNVLLTLLEATKSEESVRYYATELNPIDTNLAFSLNYCKQPGLEDALPYFQKIHTCNWEDETSITPYFSLIKTTTGLQDLLQNKLLVPPPFLVNYDAFAPTSQPELWTTELFSLLFQAMERGGIMVTYCCKGDVKRALIAAGFEVEKLKGPPGKKEMLRARKIS
jgi:tRNA U34 5-methylaminomethyl-2-thiouridine-forming methyltransferase MnmC